MDATCGHVAAMSLTLSGHTFGSHKFCMQCRIEKLPVRTMTTHAVILFQVLLVAVVLFAPFCATDREQGCTRAFRNVFCQQC